REVFSTSTGQTLMPDPHSKTNAVSASAQIDRVADRFEAAWKGEGVPAVGDFLAGWEGPARLRLLRELVLLDRSYRQQRGLPCAEEDYARAWPELRDAVEK